jgi:predicted Fe-Mo cluster-binding NifX family protein
LIAALAGAAGGAASVPARRSLPEGVGPVKIAITAGGPDPAAAVDRRFGRCQHFPIVDPDSMVCEAVEDPNVALGRGAGTQSARLMAEKGVAVALTGNCGANGFRALPAGGVAVFTGCSGTAGDVVEARKAGEQRRP